MRLKLHWSVYPASQGRDSKGWRRSGIRAVIGLSLAILIALSTIGSGRAAEEADKVKPARGFVAALRYPGLTIGPEDKVRVDLVVKNTGQSDETLYLEVVEKPAGWEATIKAFGDIVSGIFLAEDEDRTLTLSASPESKKETRLPPGQYSFVIAARTADGLLSEKTSVEVTVAEKGKVEESILLNTSYPVLRGPSDSSFEFSLDVTNDSDEDALFNLQSQAPEGWEVSFKPAYEQKQISSLQIKANQSKSVNLVVTPPRQAAAGEYPVKVRVKTSKAQAKADLVVALTGTYEIKTVTPNGLLSLSTQPGQKTGVSVYVRNEGTALQRQITFVSFKPENWEVEFNPERVENLKPGEFAQVEMQITPSGQALVGDYSVALNAKGEKTSDEMEFRVTVNASAAWGWVGISLIVLVIIGLAFIFKLLGRR